MNEMHTGSEIGDKPTHHVPIVQFSAYLES